MIKAIKNKVEMAGDLETISAEFIAIQRAFIEKAALECSESSTTAKKAIQLYESWTRAASN